MKYVSALTVVYWGFFNQQSAEYYVAFMLLTTMYKFYWDVVNDWGLFKILPRCSRTQITDTMLLKSLHFSLIKQSELWFLRPFLIYKDSFSTFLYYVAIVLDLGLRFVWVLSLSPSMSKIFFTNPAILNVFMGSLEIFRRFLWGHYKIEYEHVKSIEAHAIGYISDKAK